MIAEMSGNHNGDIKRAFALIEAAKAAGADAIKLQTYTADTITIDHYGPGFVIQGGLWDGWRLYDLYRQAHTPWEWHEDLFAKAREVGLTVFSSPFDETAIELLESLGAPAYKIASFEAVDLPLIRRAAATRKPVIISTGMIDADQIAEALDAAAHPHGASPILLHCVSAYPARPEEANLRTIGDMAKRFGVVIGLSDHTMGTEVAVAAVASGACVIEKHMTLCRADGGPDAKFSLEPAEFVELCHACRNAWAAMGCVTYERTEGAKGNIVFRRSLYIVRDVNAGETLTAENVRSIRPGHGLPPKYLPDVLGRKATRALKRGMPLDWTMVSRDRNVS
ncbi:MAG: pseudaminic acid synthase [Pseudorhodoplanes sp.]|jgi:N-acetylneuraminate synthase|nr:pseudaminic acid synthase [Pseudorhodoplanes sp.]